MSIAAECLAALTFNSRVGIIAAMKSGTVVEFIDRQKITCAVVEEVKDRRVRLLTENNREVNLSAGRLSHKGGRCPDLALGRDRAVAALNEIVRRRKALAGDVDIRQLWEVLNTEQEWIDLATMTEFCFPNNRSADHEAAVFRAFFDNRRYFKYNQNGFFPYTARQVEDKSAREEEAARRDRIILGAARWLQQVLATSAGRTFAQMTEDERLYVEILKSYYIFEGQSEHQDLAKKILKKAGAKSPDILFGLFVKLGVFSEDENVDLRRYEITVDFPAAVVEEVGALTGVLPDGVDLLRGRRDLSDLALITIDGQGTRDFDDALSIEDRGDHYRLGIHIADVGEVIRKGSAIDVEALRRASSIYMPDLKIPMLPVPLAEDCCSLRIGELRPAISLLIKLPKPVSGRVVDYEITPSCVRVQRQLSYFDANQMCTDDDEIAVLAEIGAAFRQKRLDDGAVQISLPDINVWFDEQGRLTVNRVNRESPSRMLVAELMIMANWLMARFLAERGLPAIFRSQPEPRERLYRGMQGTLFQNWMQRRLLSRFVLGPAPERHSGLGLDAYVTATSPIRKSFDLVTQRQIRAALGLETPYTAEEIERFIQVLEMPMGQVGRLQYRRLRYWLLKHLEGRAGERLEAIVLYKKRSAYQILLTDYMLECALPIAGGCDLKAEDLVRVTVQQASARKDRLAVFMA